MPHYRKYGRSVIPIPEQTFLKCMEEGHFVRRTHKGFVALLYHTGIRNCEAIRSTKKQFTITEEAIYFDVGKRAKRGRHTPPLVIPLSKPYAEEIKYAVDQAKKRVFKFTLRTGYNIVDRAFKTYPHHFRLTRITNLAKQFSIAMLVNYTGLNPTTLNFYIGLVDIEEMGKA